MRIRGLAFVVFLLAPAWLAVPWPGPAHAQGQPRAQSQSSAPVPIPERVVLLSALVRQARAAQRDCDVVAKRQAVNAIQFSMREIGRALRRQAAAISSDLARLRADGAIGAAVLEAPTAQDAALALDEPIAKAPSRAARDRLSALRERYLDFDQFESLHQSLIGILSRLEGTVGDCAGGARAAAGAGSGTACPANEFAPCRYGRPTEIDDRGLVVAVPVKRR